MFRRRQDEQLVDEDIVTDEPVPAQTWSPAQIVAVVVGIAFVILGIAALAKTGFTTDHIMRPQKNIIGFRHTPLLGAIEIAFGTLLVLSGIVAGALRSLMALLGVVAVTLGVLLVADVLPNRLHRWLGVGRPYGWMALIAGAVLLLAALVFPNFAHTTSTRQVRRHHVVT